MPDAHPSFRKQAMRQGTRLTRLPDHLLGQRVHPHASVGAATPVSLSCDRMTSRTATNMQYHSELGLIWTRPERFRRVPCRRELPLSEGLAYEIWIVGSCLSNLVPRKPNLAFTLIRPSSPTAFRMPCFRSCLSAAGCNFKS